MEIANLQRFRQRHLLLQELVHDLSLSPESPCSSYRLVEMAARLKSMLPDRVHLILGNHEFAELNDLGIAKGGAILNERFRAGLEGAYGERWKEVKDAYREFWASTPLAARTEFGVFISHSTPNRRRMNHMDLDFFTKNEPGEGYERKSSAFYLLWGRDYDQETADRFAAQVNSDVLIVAHTSCDGGYSAPNSRHIILHSEDRSGVYLLFPLDRKMTQEELLASVRRLWNT